MKVKQNPDKPIEKEVLAESIVKISSAFKALQKSGLNEKAIIVLVHDQTKLPKRDIQLVIDSLAELQQAYCS